MNAEYEKQLLAGWLLGRHREHINEFDTFDWFDEILQAVKKTDDIIQVSRITGIPITEITKITKQGMLIGYTTAYRKLKHDIIQREIARVANGDKVDKEKLLSLIQDLDTIETNRYVQATNVTEEYRKEINKRENTESLNYGIPKLDHVTGGIRRQELTVISARPSMGKTAFALQIAYEQAIKRKKVLFFPLEMSAEQMMERIVCRETKIRHEALKRPKNMTEEERTQLEGFLQGYDETVGNDLFFIEGVRTLSDIKQQIENYRPDIVFVDQLSQLREHRRFNTIREQFSYMTNELKTATMDLDIPIILLAQINRDAQNAEPTLANLKESGSIEEDSDNVIMLHQTGETSWDYTPTDIIVRKQRNGARDIKIETTFIGNKFIFKEVAKMEV